MGLSEMSIIDSGLSKQGSLISKPLPSHGNSAWEVKTAPTLEPITVDELKIFARIDGTVEDDLLGDIIKSVRMAAEAYLGRALISQTIRLLMDWWPGVVVELPRPPLISILLVATIDEDDIETTYSSDNYYVVTEAIPGKLILKQGVTAPYNSGRSYGGYVVEYKAGYGMLAVNVPSSIRDALKLWATVVYEERAPAGNDPPPKARPMLDLFRVLRV